LRELGLILGMDESCPFSFLICAVFFQADKNKKYRGIENRTRDPQAIQ